MWVCPLAALMGVWAPEKKVQQILRTPNFKFFQIVFDSQMKTISHPTLFLKKIKQYQGFNAQNYYFCYIIFENEQYYLSLT